MSLTKINEELINLLQRQLADEHIIEPETDLLSDLALESVQIMEFVVEVEDYFEIAISLEALGEIRTIKQFALLVEKTKDKQ